MVGKLVEVQDLVPGTVLADAVLAPNGKVLLGNGVALTERHIFLLNSWDVKCVYAVAEEAEAAEPVKAAAEPDIVANGGLIAKSHYEFEERYGSIAGSAVQAFDFMRKQNLIPVPCLRDTAHDIHQSVVKYTSTVTSLLLIDGQDIPDFVSQHSINVAFYASFIARQLHWSDKEIREVALAALLHHAGKLSAGTLIELHTQTHIAEAAVLLRKTKGLSLETILGIIQHREHMDGSGIPTGVAGTRIHPYAKVIAIADSFDAQIQAGEQANPFPVLDLLRREMFGKLDTEICTTFLNRVKDNLLHTKVVLANGREAEIVYFRPNGSSLPLVRTADNQILDLEQLGYSVIQRIALPN
ncbi:hypothetical protein P22_1010 [Propionispora sp. 2/2-37]|uniref:HD-GYP domain-containing protein n=1 Tax=Propionispora sp. 2/2-37 TaxID=1677858 RepID=UPI0006BB6BEC|nr:HD domain-containing phosphohydrolase [Propionispora sp. 2/2-37]CUH94941.1 hypothetical protein P22_1010 [Propionispora sp. 2/2-37]